MLSGNSNVVPGSGLVDSDERIGLVTRYPLTIWFTGLSGSGKSTLAFGMERRFVDQGSACSVLDGDRLRMGLNNNLGFSENDRSENIRRAAELAKLMNEAGLIVLVALISPRREDRALARSIVGPDFYREVYVKTPIEVCELRDPKGLYRKARLGLVQHFTGISAAYESPLAADLEIDTSIMPLDDALTKILDLTRIHERVA